MPNARDRQLDGLRAVAVSLVLYAHFLAAHDTYWGHVGVRLFFVLSGFLITRLLLDARSAPEFQSATALKSFYIRRALRIFPPYFAMLGFVWLVNLEQSRGTLLWHALYVSNFWYAIRDEWTPWLLCHTWSLSIEEQFYVVWPLIILLAPRRAIEQICVGAVVLSLAYRFCWPVTGPPSLARDLLPPASMDALASGAWLAAYRSRTAVWPRWMQLGWAPFARRLFDAVVAQPRARPVHGGMGALDRHGSSSSGAAGDDRGLRGRVQLAAWPACLSSGRWLPSALSATAFTCFTPSFSR